MFSPLQKLQLFVILLSCTTTSLGQVPTTRIDTVVDNLHGQQVKDDYRWLEGDNSKPDNMGLVTDEVAAWTDAQNAYTRSVLDKLPGRQALESRLRELMEVPTISMPGMYGKRYFYARREGGQPQYLRYVREGVNGEDRLLLDPQAIDASGLTTVSWTAPSEDGELMAFGMYSSGDENSVLYLMDVDSGEWLADEIPGKVNFIRWLSDSSGFFYSRLEDLDNAYSSVTKFHRLGTHHRLDKVLFRQQDIEFFYGEQGKSAEQLETLKTTWGPSMYTSRDGRHAVIWYWTGTASLDLWVADLEAWSRTGKLDLQPALIGAEGRFGDMHFEGSRLYLQHSLNAPTGTLSLIDLDNPDYQHWLTIVPSQENRIMRSASFARGIIAINYLENAHTRIALYNYKGKSLGDLEMPGIGSAAVSTEEGRTEAFLSFSSYNMPRSIYHLDLKKGRRTLWARPEVPVDPESIEVEQVWYPSKDGTRISMFIIHKKGLKRDGHNPAILYGYGGFDISMTPRFSATMFPWYEPGGVYAVANLRGGGEYGSAWHEAGMLENKQNVFDDFIAAGEWLVENGYTNPKQLGIAGGSNGGLLTGAAVVQRPDLFSAVISAVPLLDMLRFENFLMARYWVGEYGSAQNAQQYPFLRAYSPYQNVETGQRYPAVLFTAGENDSRVHALHARKMTALMQASTVEDPAKEPILLWVDRDAGHGAGKPLDLQIRDIADQRIFMMWQLGMLNR
jgi:prolyl oligopeptidase